jgi:hypothetical protein
LSTPFFLEIYASYSKKVSGEARISFQSFYGKRNADFQFLIRRKIGSFSTLPALLNDQPRRAARAGPLGQAVALRCVPERDHFALTP